MVRRWARAGVGAVLMCLPAAALQRPVSAQMSFEAALKDLDSADTATRLQAVQMFKRAAYPESAIPLAAALTDPVDQIQLEAIAAELNIFLADRVVSSRRVGPVLEARDKVQAEAVFAAGPFALSARPVPVQVLTALSRAVRDESPTVALEAVYALGSLGPDASGTVRAEILRLNGPPLAGMLGEADPARRIAAARVIGRLYERRPYDPPIDESVGDAVILALNDPDRDLQLAAMEALGAMRYGRAVQSLGELFQYYRRNRLGLAALAALARIGHFTSAELLLNELTAGSADTKTLAIEGLARIGDPKLAAPIREALARERNQGVLLAERFAAVILSGGRIDPLVEALGRTDLRARALQYLIQIAPGRTAAFGAARQDPDARIRADIADVLGFSYDPAALPLVEAMRRDADLEVSRAADRAAARLRRLQ